MAQLFANNAYGSLAGNINGAATTIILAAGNGARFPSPTGGDFFYATLIGIDANGAENTWEIVQCTARSTDQLTVVRAQEGTTAASWNAGTRIEIRWTAAGVAGKVNSANGTASGLTLNDGYTEEVFAVTGTTPALSPTNGSIQTWTLTANSTPTAGTWTAGQSLTLMIDDGSAYTINWTSLAVTWKTDGGSAPTLNTTGYTVIALWKVGTTIYGARVGDA